MKETLRTTLLCLMALCCGSMAADEITFDFDCTTPDGTGIAVKDKGLSTSSKDHSLTATINGESYKWIMTGSSTDNYQFTVAKKQDALQIGSSTKPNGNFTFTLQTGMDGVSTIEIVAYSNGGSSLSAGVGDAAGNVSNRFVCNGNFESTVEATKGESAETFVFSGYNANGNVIVGGTNDSKYLRIKSIRIVYSAINSVDVLTTDGQAADAPTYNLAGQRVSLTGQGIYVRNGKKFVGK